MILKIRYQIIKPSTYLHEIHMKMCGLFVPQLPLAKFTIFLHKFNESSSSLYTKRVYSYKMSFKRNFVVWAEYIINSTRLPLLKTKKNILNIKIIKTLNFSNIIIVNILYASARLWRFSLFLCQLFNSFA